jgi:hypothetical protein
MHGPDQYNGREGDIYGGIYLTLFGDNSLSAWVYMERLDVAGNTSTELIWEAFPTALELDHEYRFSIELINNQMIFRCEADKIVHTFSGTLYPPANPWKAVNARVYAAPGKSGVIKTRFDDVRVWKRQYGIKDAITVLQTTTGQPSDEAKDIDDFTGNNRLDPADGTVILQNASEMRIWP